MVANNANISPKPGTRYKAKATNTNAIVAIIVALGCILKTHKPLPYLFLTIAIILTSLMKINNL